LRFGRVVDRHLEIEAFAEAEEAALLVIESVRWLTRVAADAGSVHSAGAAEP